MTKKRTALSLLTLVLPLLGASCNDDSVPQDIFAISYFVEVTGGAATVSQIQYTDTNGNNVTVMSPVLPWTIAASRGMSQSAQLVVTGSTGAASTIAGRIQDDPAVVANPTTYASSTCPENTNPCSISIGHTF